ncbi:MAG: RDD family protein [Thermoanaerobaculia bacterium]
MTRFDEIELQAVPLGAVAADAPVPATRTAAPRLKRLLAFLTDVSLFAALTFALMPLVPASRDGLSIAALAGFIVVVSYYYFVGTWMLWGKTVGGTIFDVRVAGDDGESLPLWGASMRWAALWISLLTCGIGFLIGLPDRLSQTKSV